MLLDNRMNDFLPRALQVKSVVTMSSAKKFGVALKAETTASGVNLETQRNSEEKQK